MGMTLCDLAMRGRSGARFFAVATQGRDLVAQFIFPQPIPAGEGNGEGELQLLTLMLTVITGCQWT